MMCDGCGNETLVVRYSNQRGFVCHPCIPSEEKPASTLSPHVLQKEGNRYKPKMTRAEAMHIKTRRLRPDGEVRPDRRWDTKAYD